MNDALELIFVNFNSKADVLACLASIDRTPPKIPHRIVVVDNASGDGSAGAVRAAWPAVTVMALSRNVGFAAANNTAIRATTAPLVLLLNSDTLVPPGALDALIDRLHA